MTSKNLFFRRMKQDLEQRIWLPVLFFIIGFLALEISLLSRIDLWRDRFDFVERMEEYLMNTFFSPNSVFTVLTVGVAIVSALGGFAYMHSAKKLDVYHSIPIKREKLFSQQYTYGILYYAVPLVLHVLITYGMCAANGFGGMKILGQAAGFLLVQILIYLVCYAVSVFAVTLTGNLVISVLGCCVLSAYSLVLPGLKLLLMDRFYKTYYNTTDIYDFPAFSPVHLVLEMADHMNIGNEDYLNYTEYMWDYGKILLMAVIYTAIAIFLYKKRPTEVAGKTMAFPWTEPIVKTMVVFPASIVSGYIFAGISSNSDDMGWFVFGCIFGFVIVCPLMEVIFRKDVKAVLAHPLQLVFNGVCVMLVLGVLHFDVLGYDTYIPDEDKVESYAVYLGGMPYIGSSYGSSVENLLAGMEITDNPGARKLFEHAAQITRPVRIKDMDYSELRRSYSDMVVRYNLKNGRTVYRNYLIDITEEQVLQWLGEMTDSMEYKLGAYPVLTESHEKNYIGIMVDSEYDSERIRLSESEMRRFVETYQRELTNLTFAETLEEFPVAELSFLGGKPEDGEATTVSYAERAVVETVPMNRTGEDFEYYSEEYGYEIYPSFTQTLALLEEYDAAPMTVLSAEAVSAITIEDDSQEEDDTNGLLDKVLVLDYVAESGEQEQIEGEKIEAAELEQLLAAVVPGNLSGNSYAQERIERYIDVRIRYMVEEDLRYINCHFRKGSIPEFVVKDLAEAAAETGK